jgi:hypothetical protein
VFDSQGAVVAEETLGDGIELVMATQSGNVWVSYFDEGVYGDYGRGSPGPTPMGAAGIVRFSSDLVPEWRFPFGSPFGTIDDCYAMNVDGQAVWACYYSDFPIVRITDDDVTGWSDPIHGARALIVGDEKVAVAGGYKGDHDRLVSGELTADSFVPTDWMRLVLPDGHQPPLTLSMVGRESELNVVVGHSWYKSSLDDV